MLRHVKEQGRSAVLVGFESSGKSALFRGLSGMDTGEESNFRGSTVSSRRARLADDLDLVDLPGIRLKDDSVTTRLALGEIQSADAVVLVVRGTHAQVELPLLLDSLMLKDKRTLLVLTFEDKASDELHKLVLHYKDWLGIPVLSVDSRSLTVVKRKQLLEYIDTAKPVRKKAVLRPAPRLPVITPQHTWFEHPLLGRPLALLTTLLLFAVPVLLAYLGSQWLQPIADRQVIDPLRSVLNASPAFIQSLLIGDYGMISLGLYSFLWAFPVVLLLGISVAVAEESGLKDRITDALDGWLRVIGLSGRDLIPVLSGFGCNVVAVFQSRACSACSRKSCVSLIAFGSACSYQIGASLSVFGSGGHPWLFVPYLAMLFVIGALHTRIWNRSKGQELHRPLYETKTFLQPPSLRAVGWRVRSVIKQFLMQAMPIFIGICLAATLLERLGIMNRLARLAAPLLGWFHLPEEAAGGIIFSILRKDGLLTLNRDNGAFLQTLSAGQLLVLVYLASTLTACLVTLWTVRKELGWRFAGSMAGKQAVTSVVSASVIMYMVIG
ncbi:nucleoside recognition domain-containing protein [Paenibacillus sepulcri]